MEVIIMNNTKGQMEEMTRIQASSLLSGMKKYLDAQSFNFSSVCRYDIDKNFVAAYTPNGSIFVAE